MHGAMAAQGCVDGLAQLGGSGDKSGMLQCFVDRIDFCLAKDFPGKDFLKEHFEGVLHEKGIYIDERVEMRNERNAVLLGACEATSVADGYAVCRLYAKHSTRLVVEAEGNAFVMVDALDDAVVEVHCTAEAKVVVNLYARATAVSGGEGCTKIVHKHKETYDL